MKHDQPCSETWLPGLFCIHHSSCTTLEGDAIWQGCMLLADCWSRCSWQSGSTVCAGIRPVTVCYPPTHEQDHSWQNRGQSAVHLCLYSPHQGTGMSCLRTLPLCPVSMPCPCALPLCPVFMPCPCASFLSLCPAPMPCPCAAVLLCPASLPCLCALPPAPAMICQLQLQ